MSPARLPLPIQDLLDALKARGVPLGVREYLVVGRLLKKWDDPDPASLRVALAAVLARNQAEAAMVREEFDRRYSGLAMDWLKESVAPARPLPRPFLHWLRSLGMKLRSRWVPISCALMLGAATGFLAYRLAHPDPPPVEPPIQSFSDRPEEPPDVQKCAFPDVPLSRVRDESRALALAIGIGAITLGWLYRVRILRLAAGRARVRWSRTLDELPEPSDYEVASPGVPPFSPDFLEDAATLMGRRFSTGPEGRDLDVDRTLEATLRAGLAPSVVFQKRSSTLPVIVLVDVADDMKLWRDRVDALVAGVESRGVALERWEFDVDAGRVWRAGRERSPIPLSQLYRLRAENPLLVVSTGEGVLLGTEKSVADWVAQFGAWRQRAWINPIVDPAYWRSGIRSVPGHVWPMTRHGILAAARELIQGEAGSIRVSGGFVDEYRPVTSLDVQRLLWLAHLAPRKDPRLLELLRQKFCDHVSPAALIEVMAHTGLVHPPAVGPSSEGVHRFLVSILDASRPPERSLAFERWRLDRALQGLHVPELSREALGEMEDLSKGPMAAEVETALRLVLKEDPAAASFDRTARLTGESQRVAKSRILLPISRRGSTGIWRPSIEPGKGGLRWTWPQPAELTAFLVAGAFAFALAPMAGPLASQVAPKVVWAYELDASLPESGPFSLQVGVASDSLRQDYVPPRSFELYQDDRAVRRAELIGGSTTLELGEEDRGHCYSVRAALDHGTLAASEVLWIPPARPTTGWVTFRLLGPNRRPLSSRSFTLSLDGGPDFEAGATALELSIGPLEARVTVEGFVPVDTNLVVTAAAQSDPQVVEVRLEPPAPKTGTLDVRFVRRADGRLVAGGYRVTKALDERSGTSGKPIDLTVGRWRLRASVADTIVDMAVVIRAGSVTSYTFEVGRVQNEDSNTGPDIRQERQLPEITSVNPQSAYARTQVKLEVRGRNFSQKAEIWFQPGSDIESSERRNLGLEVQEVNWLSDSLIVVVLRILENAAESYSVVVASDGARASQERALYIERPASAK